MTVPPSPGISHALALERARRVSGVRYELTLTVPEQKNEPIKGRETIYFALSDATSPVVVDFSQAADHVLALSVGGKPVPIESVRGHLVIPVDALRRGDNALSIEFVAGDLPLNRNDEFFYSLFVPARASEAFPCFDQPDLKASMVLTLDIPAGWQAVANGFERSRETTGNRATVRFAPTQPLPTYLFGFAAGRFAIEVGQRRGRTYRMYHRETDTAKVARNKDALFDLHDQSMQWLEDYTARQYPFEKLDFILIPAFQFSGMEHAGAMLYNASSLLLDETATQEQELARANTIAHETAHMWFGDLVTMRWFDDVWLKEVFANFMAAKIVNPSFPNIDHELRFLLAHYPSAYDVDRTADPNPIHQALDNLNEAGSLYGNVIYDKAPIVMRQLETILGADVLRDGLREYLSRYAFSNATWTELVQILDAKTPEDLASWSQVWVEEPGRPTITTDAKIVAGQVASLAFTQSDPAGRSRLWNQRLQLALGYENGTRFSPLLMNSASVEAKSARGVPAPLYVLANGEGVGYGLFRLDERTRTYLLDHLPGIGDALTRGTAWVTLWDEMLEGDVAPRRLIDLALAALPVEREEQNVQRILGYLHEAYWLFLNDADRKVVAPRVEQALRSGMSQASGRSLKAAYFNAFRRTAQTAPALKYLERVWRRQESIPGLTFAETDFIAMAQELAVRGVTGSDAIVAEQIQKTENPDRKARLGFVAPALSADQAARDRFFASLSNVDNRRHEPWVIDALTYLHHPLRASQAERYIRPSLELLVDIQRTGDIFFPYRWTDATLSGHNSPAAAALVAAYLDEHRDLPRRLRQIIEQTGDTLKRASRIVTAPKSDPRPPTRAAE
jgi:aminopeptidase N